MGGMGEDEETSKMLSLRTLKVIKPRKRELDINEEKTVRRKMKQLTRKMRARGMKLQYTDDDRVFFDDVAGIGNAKVCFGNSAREFVWPVSIV